MDAGDKQPAVDLNIVFRKLLEGSGWTQSRAAEELSLDVATVNRYVGGKMVPTLTSVKLLASLLGRQVPGVNEGQVLSDAVGSLDYHESRLVGALRRVPAQRRRMVAEALITTLEAHESEPVSYLPTRKTNPEKPPNPTAEAVKQEVLNRILARRQGRK